MYWLTGSQCNSHRRIAVCEHLGELNINRHMHSARVEPLVSDTVEDL